MKLTVSVTQEDIDKGVPKQRCACPAWHAIRRAAPYLDRLEVIYLYVTCLAPDGLPGVIPLPDIATSFIARFDARMPVSPITFDLDVPDHLIPAGVTA